MRGLILAFALGVCWLQTRPDLPDLVWLGLLPPGLALLAWPASGRGAGLWKRALLWLLILAAGFFYAAWRAERRLADVLPSVWEGREVVLLGRVVGLPERTPQGPRFMFRPERVETPGAVVPSRLLLSGRQAAPSVPVEPRGGDCLRLTARLYRPHGAVNPHGFDYEAWLLQRGIRATGVSGGPSLATGECGIGVLAWLDRAREHIRDRLHAALAGRPHAGIVVALAVGDQDAIAAGQWALFRDTGVTHLMSISGLHVTLLSGLIYAGMLWAWRRHPGLCLRLPARRAALAAGLVTAAGYVALAGFGLPALRTLFMLTGAAAALWGGWATSASRVLAAALGLTLLLDPWAVLAPGFWLSYGAVAALLLAASGRLGRAAAWRGWLAAQWVVTLALTPVLLLLFHAVSLVSPLANALAIPLISLLAVPLTLAAVLLPMPFLAEAAHAVVALVMAALGWLAAWPQPVWHGAAPGWAALLLAVLGAGMLLLPRGLPGRGLGFLLFLPLFWPRLPVPAPGEFQLTVLDVGQGLAVLVRTAHHAWLYDSGPAYAGGGDAGERVVAPYLHAMGIHRLDALVVSHDDSDHAGGAASLRASHAPPWLLTSLAGLPTARLSPRGQALLRSPAGVEACVAGRAWSWDGVRFSVLHPPARQYAHPGFSDNDRSCVLRLEGAYGSALLPGDVERLGQLTLLAAPTALQADVLVLPHHGSAGSLTEGWVAATAPSLAPISVGRRNRFGHPAAATLWQYRRQGAVLPRTDQEGAIEVRLGADGLHWWGARQATPRYWRGR